MIIQVCSGCEKSKPIVEALRALKKQYGARVTLEIVDCLDQCHYSPVATVNGQLIIWADPVKLNIVVTRLLSDSG